MVKIVRAITTGFPFGGRRAAVPATLGLLMVLASCGAPANAPTAASAPASASADAAASTSTSAEASRVRPSAAADWEAEWSKVTAAAKQEKTIAVLAPPGDVYRQVFDAFQAKFGISVEIRAGNGTPDLVPAVTTEREAGKYLWDVAALAPSTMFNGFKPAGALDPLGSALILPEVLDDGKWLHGFDGGWADRDKTLSYIFVSYKRPIVQINRQIVPESQLDAIDQLWDAKWRGKIAIQDPRVPSAGSGGISVWHVTKGEDKLRSLWAISSSSPLRIAASSTTG